MSDAENIDLASRWKRLSGALIDSLIAVVLTLPLLFATGVFSRIERGEQPGIGYQFLFFSVRNYFVSGH